MSQRGTPSSARPRARAARPRRDLLRRTALCGVLTGLAAALASPAAAIIPVGPAPLPVQAATPPQVNTGGTLPTITGGTNELDIALHGARTVIDWSSYNVDAGNAVKYTFDARNWIVLNRIADGSPPTIAGVVEGRVNGAYGGNIWFASPAGMIFGAGAKIDAGGILISAAAPDLAGFLDPGNLAFSFPGDEVLSDVPVLLQAGSTITGHGGLVALISPSVISESGASVAGQGGSSVLYGATQGYQLRLQQGAPGDFDLVDFIVPGATLGSGAAIGLDLQGATSANSVFVAAVSRSAATGAVINLQGLVTAQAASSDGGDIVLSGGGGIVGRAAGPSAGGTTTDIYLNQATASRDIQLQNTGQVFGHPFVNPDRVVAGPPAGGLGSVPNSVLDPSQVSVLTAGRDIRLVSTRSIALGDARASRNLAVDGLTLQANTLSSGGAVSLTTEAGDLSAAGLSAGGGGLVQTQGSLQVDKLDLTGALKIKTGGAASIGRGTGAAGGGMITLTTGSDATVNAASATFDTVISGGVANLKAGSLNIGTVTARQVLASGGSVTVGSAVSAGDVYVSASGGAASVGSATAGDDIFVLATGGAASLTKAVLTGAAPDTVGPAFTGNPDVAGNGRVVSVQSSGDALLGLGTGAIAGATKVTVQAGQDALVDLPGALPAGLSVTAARDVSLRAATVTFGAVQAGRDLSLTATAGDFTNTAALTASRNITIAATGALQLGTIQAASGSITLTGRTVAAGALSAGQDLTLTATGGDVTSAAALSASRNVTIAATGALQLGDIQAASGSITLTGRTVAAGALAAGQDLALTATGGGLQLASFKAGRDLIAKGSTLSLGAQTAPIGRDLSIATPGDFTSASDLAAGRDLTLSVGGVASLKGLSAPGTVDIVAGDLALAGTLTAPNVQIESASGALRVGGSAADGAPASGLWLDNAEFGRIHASNQVSLYAGPTAGSARGDLTVLALDVTPQSTPQVNLFAGGGHNALVQGVVAPTTSGGVLAIGDATNTAWRPTSILVSGAIGSATFNRGAYTNVRAFDDVRLRATDDIIIGSQRFIGLIQPASIADIEIGRNKPAGVAPTASEQNRVLVAAGRLELSASGKVVSQNTAPSPALSVGLFLNGAAAPDLIIDPPQLVDLYGSFVGPAGVVVSSFSAGTALAFAVVDAAGNPTAAPLGAVYRFNSCAVGTSQCSAASQITSNLQQTNPVLTTPSGAALGSDLGGDAGGDAGGGESGGGSSGGGGRGGSRANGGPGLLSVAPGEADEVLSDLVTTGAGSEEIWRKRDRAPDKAPDKAAKP